MQENPLYIEEKVTFPYPIEEKVTFKGVIDAYRVHIA